MMKVNEYGEVYDDGLPDILIYDWLDNIEARIGDNDEQKKETAEPDERTVEVVE